MDVMAGRTTVYGTVTRIYLVEVQTTAYDEAAAEAMRAEIEAHISSLHKMGVQVVNVDRAHLENVQAILRFER
jgi:hypothetical protein